MNLESYLVSRLRTALYDRADRFSCPSLGKGEPPRVLSVKVLL